MDELEEGELVEDDSTLVIRVSNNLWRADTGIAGNSVSSSGAQVPRKPTKLLRHGSSDSDSDEDHQPSSDDDYEPGSKKLNVQGNCIVSRQHLDDEPKKKFNIWGSVLEEQSLAKDLSGWFGVNKKVDSDRDVETYDYTNALKDDRPVLDVPCDSGPQPGDDSGVFAVADICDKETFGTAAMVKTATNLLSGDSEGELSYAADDSIEQSNQHDRKKIFRRKTRAECPDRAPAKQRLGVAIENDDSVGSNNAVTVGVEIHRTLSEPKHMVDTFVRIVQVLGSDKALDLLTKTETVEKSGGLKIMNGERRRTPGGVYLYLLKGDSGVSKAQYNEIFKEKFELQKRKQKEAKKRQWIDRSEKIVREAAMNIDDQPLIGRKELYLAGTETESLVPDTERRATGDSINDDGEFELEEPCSVDIVLDL